MQMIARAMALALAAAATGSALGACASGSSSSTPPTTRASVGTTSTTATTAATASTTTSTTALTTNCQPSQLHIVLTGYQGAAGTIEVTFSLTNTSTSLCTMSGYPGMVLLDAQSKAQPTVVTRGGGLAFENLPVTTVSLAASQVAYFNLGYNDVNSAPVGAPRPRRSASPPRTTPRTRRRRCPPRSTPAEAAPSGSHRCSHLRTRPPPTPQPRDAAPGLSHPDPARSGASSSSAPRAPRRAATLASGRRSAGRCRADGAGPQRRATTTPSPRPQRQRAEHRLVVTRPIPSR